MGWYNSNWSHRVSVTVALDKTLARVDLSNAPAAFFSIVKNGGGDIRVTKADGTTEVARDVRSCDTSGQTGWIVFATGESKSATTAQYKIYIGNAAASDYAAGDTYGRNNTYDSEHVIVFALDEDPSTGAPQFTDRTGNGNDGTAQGAMTSGDLVAGQMDGAVDLDGGNDYITSPATFPAGSFSVYCLAKVASSPSTLDTASSIDKTEAGNFGVFYLQLLPAADNWRFAVVNTADTLFTADSTTAITPNIWQFVGGAYNNSTKGLAVNVDGTEEDTGTLTGTRSTATGNTFVGAGYFAGPADYFDGILDEYVLLNVAITEAEFDAIQAELLDNANAVTFGALQAMPAGSGSGSGAVPADQECYDTIARDTTFNRLTVWQPRTFAVCGMAGSEALAQAAPLSESEYFAGSASGRIAGSKAFSARIIKNDLVKHLRKMAAEGCPVLLAAFGFDRHELWLTDSRLHMIDERDAGGRMAGADMRIVQQRERSAIAQVTNLLEFAPWYNTVAALSSAAGSGSGSGGSTYVLKGRRDDQFTGPLWQVAQGDSVDSLGTFAGSAAVLEFTFPIGGMRILATGDWAGTIEQLGWDDAQISSTTKTYGVDAEITLDDAVWKLRITATAADEMPRLTVVYAGRSDGVRDGVCIDCSDPDAVAETTPPWVQIIEDTPDTIYYLDSNKRVRSAPISLTSAPWTPTTLWSAGRTPTILRVDQAAGCAFVKESTNNVADYIKRYDLLTGDNGTDIVTESWTTLEKLKDFRLDTANQLVYVLVGFGTPEAIDIYDYDGNLQDSITLTDNSSVGQLAFDGDYLMYQATTDKLYKVVISTQIETLVANLSSPDPSQNSAAMDLDAGHYFYYHDSAGIRRTGAPNGGGETQIYNTAVDQSGLEIDTVNQLVYFGSTERIVEIGYSGENDRVVVDAQADTFEIRSISLGI